MMMMMMYIRIKMEKKRKRDAQEDVYYALLDAGLTIEQIDNVFKKVKGAITFNPRLMLTIGRDIWTRVFISLSYNSLGTLEIVHPVLKSKIINWEIWKKKFQHDFPGLKHIGEELPSHIKRFLDDRTRKNLDYAKDRNWLADITFTEDGKTSEFLELPESRYRSYTLWKRYYEYLVRFPQLYEPILNTIKVNGRFVDMKFMSNGEELIYITTSQIYYYDIFKQTDHLIVSTTRYVQTSLALLPNDNNIIIIGRADGYIVFYDRIQNDDVLAIKAHEREVKMITCSPDGKLLCSISNELVTLWKIVKLDSQTYYAAKIQQFPVENDLVPRSFDFSPSSKKFVIMNDEQVLSIWDGGKKLKQIETDRSDNGAPLHVEFSKTDDDTIYIGYNRAIDVVDISNIYDVIPVRNLEYHRNTARPAFSSFSISPTNNYMGFAEHTVRIDEVRIRHLDSGRTHSPKLPADLLNKHITQVVFSPDGLVFASYGDGMIQFWGIPPKKTLLSSCLNCGDYEPIGGLMKEKLNPHRVFCSETCQHQWHKK